MKRYLQTILVLAVLLGGAWAQTGRLEPGDAQLDSGEFFDVQVHEGEAGSTLTITLTSSDFDPYLIVLGPGDEVLLQEDDSEGQGLNVMTTLTLPSTGSYTIAVTSATAGETGAYELKLEAGALTIPPTTNPLGTAPPAVAPGGPLEGSFSDGTLTVTLHNEGGEYRGQFTLGGQSYDAVGQALGSVLSGSFQSGEQDYAFTATLDGDALTFSTGGASYTLQRQGTPEQSAAPPMNPLAANPPTQGQAPAPVEPTPQIQPRPGFITGTAFDTQGRPLPGAGVLITGTTFAQGQRTDFETTTGPDGTYAVQVPAGRYEAKAWIDVSYNGAFFSRLLHPLSGRPSTQIDSTVGGNLDFQWKLTGLTAYSTPPGTEDTDFYGASIDLSYCGLPASAYCSAEYDSFPTTPIAPEGATVRVTLTPTAPLIDGSQGQVITYDIPVAPQDPDYPYGTAPNRPAGYENGGGGRTVLGKDWPYHSKDLNDIPLGTYRMTAVAHLPDGTTHALKLGLDYEDVSYESLDVTFTPWEDYQARSYIGGGITQLTVYIRD